MPKYSVTVKPSYTPEEMEIEAEDEESAKELALDTTDVLEVDWEVESIEELDV